MEGVRSPVAGRSRPGAHAGQHELAHADQPRTFVWPTPDDRRHAGTAGRLPCDSGWLKASGSNLPADPALAGNSAGGSAALSQPVDCPHGLLVTW
jgi:hypothetical protein